MAKKPMTKSQIVSHFAQKFELSKKTASGIIEELRVVLRREDDAEIVRNELPLNFVPSKA